MAQLYRFKKNNFPRRTGLRTLREALDQMLKTFRIKDRFDETYLEAHWEEIVGKPVAARTVKVYTRNKNLYLLLQSAPLREELLRDKSNVILLINKRLGYEAVADIIFL